MPITIPVAHDFSCPWCWVGLFQAKKLRNEFDVAFDWLGCELYPEELGFPEKKPPVEPPANKPKTPGRFQLLLWAEGMVMPVANRPQQIVTHNAHEAVEYAKLEGRQDEMVEAIYRAYWEEGLDISDVKVLKGLAKGVVAKPDAMVKAINRRQFASNIVLFDDQAYEMGIYNVPTFTIAGEKIAEHPYGYIRQKALAAIESQRIGQVYADLQLPEPPPDRPYIAIDMVATIDGKTVSGTRDESVADLGSKVDHLLMKRLESQFDAVMLGAQTLRVTTTAWNPRSPKRIVLTVSGDVPYDSAFMTQGEAYVATVKGSKTKLPTGVRAVKAGTQEIDLKRLMKQLRELGIERLLVLGGSETNAGLIREGLVDELFLTVAPKVKLGRDLPTYAGGEPLTREEMPNFNLVESHTIGDEVFLRYRRKG